MRQKLDMELFLLVGSNVAGSTAPLKGAFHLPVRCDTSHKVLIYSPPRILMECLYQPPLKTEEVLQPFQKDGTTERRSNACRILHVVLARMRAICSLLFQMLSSFLIWKWPGLQFGFSQGFV